MYEMTGIDLTGLLVSYISNNFTGIISDYIEKNKGSLDSIIISKQQILQLQQENIGFRYSHIQSVFGWLAVVGFVLFGVSYFYIWHQAKKTIDKIRHEKEKLEKEYAELLKVTKEDIQEIKDNQEFSNLLQKCFALRANRQFEDTLDLYDDLLGKQYVLQNNDRKYIIYREIADTHYQIGENSEQIYENSSNYLNAIQSMNEAMKIYVKQTDETFLATLQDKYDNLNSLTPSEQ